MEPRFLGTGKRIVQQDSYNPSFDRRAFLGAVPAVLVLAACSKQPVQTDQKWTKAGASTSVIDHSIWDGLLRQYVRPSQDGINRVDYAALRQKDMAALERYLARMQTTQIENYSREEQFAFWVNLYNAATVNVILEHYPLKSIKDIGLFGQGPWKDKILKIGGKDLSLDDIEHGILRPVWKDVRVHYAVNCASLGCPNLAARAYTAEGLDMMLDDAARAYINHPRGFARVDGALIASSIYDWYGADWGGPAGVLDHARKYASDKTRAMLGDARDIDGFDYNWSLNDVA